MRLNIAILVSLAALTISCSKNSSVEDDWPGIDEIKLDKISEGPQKITFAGPLTLKSKLGIPAMGKDVSFNLTTNCHRSLPESSKKQSVYTKRLSYEAGQFENLSELPTSEFLPPEVLIFPDFFKSCDISLTAINSIGSSQTSELKDLEFEFSKKTGRQLITQERLNYRDLKLPVKYSSFANIEFSHVTKLSFINSKVICYVDRTVQIINSGAKAKTSISANHLEHIKFNNSIPTATCIASAINNDGETLTSQRFQVIDKYADPYSFEFIRNIAADPHKQIFYDNISDIQNDAIASLVVKAPKSRDLKIKFKKRAGKNNVAQIIKGVEETNFEEKYGDAQYSYRKIQRALPAEMYWSESGKQISTDSFEIKTREHKFFTLHMDPGFSCHNSKVQNKSAEIGFSVKLKKDNPIFELEVHGENDFTSFIVAEFNLFELHNHKVTTNMYPTAKPDEMKYFERINDDFFLKLMFRNNSVQPGVPLRMQYTMPSMNPTDDSASFQIQNPTPPKRYPFRMYSPQFAEQTTCESKL